MHRLEHGTGQARAGSSAADTAEILLHGSVLPGGGVVAEFGAMACRLHRASASWVREPLACSVRLKGLDQLPACLSELRCCKHRLVHLSQPWKATEPSKVWRCGWLGRKKMLPLHCSARLPCSVRAPPPKHSELSLESKAYACTGVCFVRQVWELLAAMPSVHLRHSGVGHEQ